MSKKLKSLSGSNAATCSPSSTPETDAHIKEINGCQLVLANTARKFERQRNHWRNEHDRILHEFQHRLTVLATSAIEATNYPEND